MLFTLVGTQAYTGLYRHIHLINKKFISTSGSKGLSSLCTRADELQAIHTI